MSELEPTVDRDDKGRWTKGGKNPWRMPAYRPGQSGHTARYKSPKQVARLCQEYLESIPDDRAPAWAGLARYMGISTQALHKYRNGEIESAHPAIVDVLEYFRTHLEAWREERLSSRDYSTSGLMFALKNHHGWRDEKTFNVQQETQTLVINVDPALAAKIQGEVIEGELIDAPQHEDT